MVHILEDIENFALIFEAIPGHNALILANPPVYTVLAASADFLSNSGVTKQQIVGKGLFETFPSNPKDTRDDGEQNLLNSFNDVVATRKLQQLPVQRYDVLDAEGTFQERYWVASNKPVLGAAGEVQYIIHTAEEITNRIKSQEKDQVIKGMALTNNLFKQAPVAISILKGSDFTVELANDKMLEMFGRPKLFQKRPIGEVLPELQAQGHIEILRNVTTTGKMYFGYESPLHVTEEGVRKLKYFNFVYQPYFEENEPAATGVLMFVNEVTEKIQNKEALHESEQRFQNLAESTEILIALSDETSSVTYFNKAWVELTGRPIKDLLQFGWLDLVHPEDREIYLNNYLNAFEERKSFTGEFRILNKEGDYRWLLAKGPPRYRADHSFAGYICSYVDITDRKQAENRLLESEQRIRSLVDSAPFPIGVYNGEEMRIELANQSITDIWGKGNNIVGKLYKDILPELDNQQIFEQLHQVYTTGVAFHAKNQQVDLIVNGKMTMYFFNYSFTPLFNTEGQVYGVMNTGSDVTDLNLAKRQLEYSESRLRSLVMSAPIGICLIKGKQLTVEMVNDSFLKLVGRTREALDDRPYLEVLPELAAEYESELQNVLVTGRSFRGDEKEVKLFRNGKEETAYFTFVCDPVKEADGSVNRVMILAYEVTEQVIARRKIEDVVQERTHELAEANNNLKRSNEELAQFAYIASHDLQEPLRKVSTFTQMLEQSLPEISDKSRDFLSKIYNSTSRMTNLIRDVLSYSQLSNETASFEEVNLQQVVDYVMSDFELLIEQKQATIKTFDLPTIHAIPLQMSQLVTNLLSNALKFSAAETKPVITIRAERMSREQVAARWLDTKLNYYHLQFSDNGIGFNPEYASRIFNIFQRLHGKTEYSGTGIGLAMCKKIAQNHNGDIYATASKGSGAVFNVILPEKQA